MFFKSNSKEIAALQQLVEQQASLLKAINRSMASIEFDLNGVVLDANDNFLSTMGYRREDIIGKQHRMFCTPEDGRSSEYDRLWSRLRSGEFVSSTFRRVARDGRTVWLEASYNPVRDASGKVTKVIKYATDVTKRIEADNEARRKLEAIDRSMAVIEFDLEGRILAVNANLTRTMGYSEADLIGKNHRMLCAQELVSSSEYADFWRRLNKGESFSGQFKRAGRGGQPVWLEATYNPIYDASGKLWKVIKFAADITPRIEQHERDASSAAQAYHISVETRKVTEHGTEVIQQAAQEMRQI